MMAKKIEFDIPDDLIPPRLNTLKENKNTNSRPATTKSLTYLKTNIKVKQPKTDVSKATNVKEAPAISIRLVFDKEEYKALLSIALLETEKTGKRCSVTNLINKQIYKLIKKGNTNV